MVDEKRNFIFVHIIKTAGTSIETALKLKRHDHRTAKKYITQNGKDIFNKMNSFAVIRNPWDKMVSQYLYLRNKTHPRFYIQAQSFEEFLISASDGSRVTGHPFQHLPYITNYQNDVVVKDFIRFENLQEDFDRVCEKLNIEAVKLPHKNRTQRANYKFYYNNYTKDLVADMFKRDLDLFDYKFNN